MPPTCPGDGALKRAFAFSRALKSLTPGVSRGYQKLPVLAPNSRTNLAKARGLPRPDFTASVAPSSRCGSSDF